MKKVFIPNDGGHDYSDAQRFGDVVICTKGAIDKWDISHMYRVMTTALEDAEPDDYLVLNSLSSLCSVASAIMAERFGEVHFLLFRNGKYIERTLILNN